MDCPFCNLKPDRNRVIYEGETIFVTPSNPRLVKGHLLVIPKRHIERPSDMTPEERKEMFNTVLMFQDKILEKVAKGCDIRENYRPFQEETEYKVNHIHFHLIPRELCDNIYERYEKLQTDVFHFMDEEEIKKSAETLK